MYICIIVIKYLIERIDYCMYICIIDYLCIIVIKYLIQSIVIIDYCSQMVSL